MAAEKYAANKSRTHLKRTEKERRGRGGKGNDTAKKFGRRRKARGRTTKKKPCGARSFLRAPQGQNNEGGGTA